MFLKSKFTKQTLIKSLFLFLLFLTFGTNIYSQTETNNKIIEDLKYLSSDEMKGRFPGTSEIDQVANMIEERFKSNGLKSFANSYKQTFSVITGVRPDTANCNMAFGVKIPKPGIPMESIKPRMTPFILAKDWLPLGWSSSSKFSGEIAFAGFGISEAKIDYDDYEGLDVKGKAVIVLTGNPDGDKENSKFAEYSSYTGKCRKASEKGASAIIFVKVQGDSANNFEAMTYYDMEKTNIIAIQANRTSVAKYFPNERQLFLTEQQIQKNKKPSSFLLPNTSVNIDLNLIKITNPTYNIIGFVPGKSKTDEYVVVGAHYDHIGMGGMMSKQKFKSPAIHNGADDNASGTAVLLELMKNIAANPCERNVVFISFSAEEMGLLGSKFFVENPTIPLDKIKAMINLDMLGRMKDNKLELYGAGTSSVFTSTIDNYPKTSDLKLEKQSKGMDRSDHGSFYNKKIPAIHLFSGFHDDYHKPSDDFEKINQKGLLKIAIFSEELIKAVANYASPIDFIDLDATK